MKITSEHPSSSYGFPVILDDQGEPVGYAPGLQRIRRTLGLSVLELSGLVGKSPRTVESWEQGLRLPQAESLYVLKGLLEKHAEPHSRLASASRKHGRKAPAQE